MAPALGAPKIPPALAAGAPNRPGLVDALPVGAVKMPRPLPEAPPKMLPELVLVAGWAAPKMPPELAAWTAPKILPELGLPVGRVVLAPNRLPEFGLLAGCEPKMLPELGVAVA